MSLFFKSGRQDETGRLYDDPNIGRTPDPKTSRANAVADSRLIHQGEQLSGIHLTHTSRFARLVSLFLPARDHGARQAKGRRPYQPNET